jgi:hypothetical protein
LAGARALHFVERANSGGITMRFKSVEEGSDTVRRSNLDGTDVEPC